MTVATALVLNPTPSPRAADRPAKPGRDEASFADALDGRKAGRDADAPAERRSPEWMPAGDRFAAALGRVHTAHEAPLPDQPHPGRGEVARKDTGKTVAAGSFDAGGDEDAQDLDTEAADLSFLVSSRTDGEDAVPASAPPPPAGFQPARQALPAALRQSRDHGDAEPIHEGEAAHADDGARKTRTGEAKAEPNAISADTSRPAEGNAARAPAVASSPTPSAPANALKPADAASPAETSAPKADAPARPQVTVVEARLFATPPAPQQTTVGDLAARLVELAPEAGRPAADISLDPQAPRAPQHAGSLKLQLHPAELGMVTASLRFSGEALSVELRVETAEAYRRLSTDSDALVQSLRGAGYEIDRVTVLPPASSATAAGRAEAGIGATGREGGNQATGGDGQAAGGGGQAADRQSGGHGGQARQHAGQERRPGDAVRSNGGIYI